jgi:hypothetical protein
MSYRSCDGKTGYLKIAVFLLAVPVCPDRDSPPTPWIPVTTDISLLRVVFYRGFLDIKTRTNIYMNVYSEVLS